MACVVSGVLLFHLLRRQGTNERLVEIPPFGRRRISYGVEKKRAREKARV